jgi:hypothetical protein
MNAQELQGLCMAAAKSMGFKPQELEGTPPNPWMSQERARIVHAGRLRHAMKELDLPKGRVLLLEWQSSTRSGKRDVHELVHTFTGFAYSTCGNFVKVTVADKDLYDLV